MIFSPHRVRFIHCSQWWVVWCCGLQTYIPREQQYIYISYKTAIEVVQSRLSYVFYKKTKATEKKDTFN